MSRLIQSLRRVATEGPLGGPSLEMYAAYRRVVYAATGVRTADTRHQPTVLCIGNFKTGTLSLASLLSGQLKGCHEPDTYLFYKMWLAQAEGRLSPEAWEQFLIRRSNTLALDFESSGFLITEASILPRVFPETRFILTLREPKDWLCSLLRQIDANRAGLKDHYWERVLERWFGFDSNSEGNTLYPFDLAFLVPRMLQFWKTSNEAAIRSLPADRSLILETKKLSNSLDLLESFMGWKPGALIRSRSYLHRTQSPQAFKGLDKIEDYAPFDEFQEVYDTWIKNGFECD